MSANECQCGKPIPDVANLCPDCVGDLRRHLYLIADRWAELEDALTWRETYPGRVGGIPDAPTLDGERRVAIAVGAVINERAVTARRGATDLVWFVAQVIREDFDTRSWTFALPAMFGNRTQDQTPALARWIASSHVDHIGRRLDRDTAEEIAKDAAKAEGDVYKATNPTGVHWAPVNLTCDMWATSDAGERVPCPGDMWALVGRDTMPDLVCDHDEAHTIDPKIWERSGWKRRLRMPLDPGGLAKLAERMGS